MATLQAFISNLPSGEQTAIAERTQQLIVEEMTLQSLRKARHLTQKQMAEKLNLDQVGISVLERRADLLLSTLQRQVKAMGGTLRLMVEFPDRNPVFLAGFATIEGQEQC